MANRTRRTPGVKAVGRPRKTAARATGSPLKALKPTKAVEALIIGMVDHGLTRAQAAERAGMTDHGAYVALRKPHIAKAYQEALHGLRQSERARNIHTAVEIRDDRTLDGAAGATARLKAAGFLEGRPEGGPTVNVQINNEVGQQPGYTVGIDPKYAHVVKELKEHGETTLPPVIEHQNPRGKDD